MWIWCVYQYSQKDLAFESWKRLIVLLESLLCNPEVQFFDQCYCKYLEDVGIESLGLGGMIVPRHGTDVLGRLRFGGWEECMVSQS